MAKDISIKPIGGYILVKPQEEEEKTASGLIIQTSGKGEKPQRGSVEALGTGKLDENGKMIAWNVKKGDVVLFKKYSPEEIEIDGKQYLIMQESDILAVVA